MKIFYKKIKRGVLTAVLVFTAFALNFQTALAGENMENDVMVEEWETAAESREVYPLLDEDGVVVGYYEPYLDNESKPVEPRYSANIDWTVGAKKYTHGDNRYSLAAGMIIEVNIQQSVEGQSYLALYNVNTGVLKRINHSSTTSGWDGKITLLENFVTDTYSFAIENLSDNSITYTGYYSL